MPRPASEYAEYLPSHLTLFIPSQRFFTTFVFYVPESCWYDTFSRNLSLCFRSYMIRFWFSKSLLIIPLLGEFENGASYSCPRASNGYLPHGIRASRSGE